MDVADSCVVLALQALNFLHYLTCFAAAFPHPRSSTQPTAIPTEFLLRYNKFG